MRRLVVFVFVFISFAGFAQDPVIFNEKIHDFGELDESTQPTSYTFSFINSSQDSLKINYVKASCGCTTPGWSQHYILPGDSGFITAQYSTYNRPGSFNKSLRISWSNGMQQTLYIKGLVNPREKNPAETYPVAIGHLRSKFQVFNMGIFTTEKPYSLAFTLFNDSKDTIKFLPEQHVLPNYLTIEMSSLIVEPQQKARISLTVDPSKTDKLGFIQSSLQLATTDLEVPVKSYLIYSSIEEYFPPLTDEEKENAPRLLFGDNTIDFGDVSNNIEIERVIILTNEGKSKLNIRQIDSNCDCVITALKKENIAPGKSTEMTVKFLTKDRTGRQYKTITVFSSDPIKPTQTLSIKANVQ